MTDANRSLERWGWASIAVNITLTAVNLTAMLASGSVAIAAEMIHNVVDLAASIAVLVGLKLASRRSRRFPYGLYKIENLVAAIVALLIFVAAYEIGRTALFGTGRDVVVTPWVLAAVLFSAVLPLVFSLFEHRAGRAAGSPSLIADAKEYRVHVFTSGVVLIALLTRSLSLPVDRIAAALVAVIIAKSGWELLRDAMRVLLDASLDHPTLLEARNVLQQSPAVRRVWSVQGRNAGRVRFLDVELELRHRDQERAARTVRHLERTLGEAIGRVERVQISVRPRSRDTVRIACPLKSASGRVSNHFGTAAVFVIAELRTEDGVVVQRRELDNPHAKDPRGRGLKVAHWLSMQEIDGLVSRDDIVDKGPGFALGEAGVEIVLSDEARSEDALLSAFSHLTTG
ncbi:MAG: cation transporter [Deltaproteobacteria bacterium]|nr:MAG: cation transporter [Deltaproteobacteria bacterium]